MMTISIVAFIALMFLALLAGWTVCSLFTVGGRSDLKTRAALMRSLALKARHELDEGNYAWARLTLDQIRDAQ